jgi:hypothetical protein
LLIEDRARCRRMSTLGTFERGQAVPQVGRAIRDCAARCENAFEEVHSASAVSSASAAYCPSCHSVRHRSAGRATSCDVGGSLARCQRLCSQRVTLRSLGLALWRRPIAVTLTVAGALSVAIELLQIWYVGRDPSLTDVVANVLGVAVGVIAAQRLAQTHRVRPDTLPIDWRLATSAAVGTVVLLVRWAQNVAPSNFANWDADFELLLGNERTADRPWRGTIAALAILSAPLSRREVRAVEELAAPEVQAALVARGAYVLPAAITLEG